MSDGQDRGAEDDDGATVIIGEHVVPGCEDEHRAWQTRLNDAAAKFAGFVGAEVHEAPDPAEDWTVVYRFDTVTHVQAWLNSRQRQEILSDGAHLHDRPATQQVLAGPTVNDELVTVVVSHRVPQALEDDFLEWQDQITEVEQGFPGFVGAELFRPVPGVQDEWTAVYRFSSDADAERWLRSDDRRRLLDAGKAFDDFELRTVHSSFGNWFDRGPVATQGPGNIKTSIAVWVGLYPTVMLLTLALSELLPDAKMWQSLLIGNLVSSFAMTYLTMPQYVSRLLGWWLSSDEHEPTAPVNLRGIAISLATVVAWAVVFWLVTVQVWSLP